MTRAELLEQVEPILTLLVLFGFLVVVLVMGALFGKSH